MNKSFFIFYTVNAFVDFINQFCTVFGVLFPAWGLLIPLYLKLGSGFGKFMRGYKSLFFIIGKLLLMGSFWTRINQGIACLLIALNRCSAIIWPFKYEKVRFSCTKNKFISSSTWKLIFQIWNKKIIYISVFLIVFSGLPFTVFSWSKEYRWYMNASTAEIYNADPNDAIIKENNMRELQVVVFQFICLIIKYSSSKSSGKKPRTKK